jgi:Uma2 family endonuclease
MGTAVQTVTLDEFLTRPEREDGQREELIEGEVIVSPGAKVWHAAIVRRLRLGLSPLEQERGYVVASDFACILGEKSMPAPDLAAVQLDRWNMAEKSEGWLDGSPELVIEVASPSNRRLYRKPEGYLEYGAEQVWIVFPKTQTLTVVTAEGIAEARLGECVEFHGVRVPVDSIFGTE